jgi:hypothetical protein
MMRMVCQVKVFLDEEITVELTSDKIKDGVFLLMSTTRIFG